MTLSHAINRLRLNANMSQEQFAGLFHVSQQSVQKWESGDSVPELSKLIAIAKHFGISLDALILGNNNRIVEEMKNTRQIKPQYSNVHDWEFYSSNLQTEYVQSIEEGLDIDIYKDAFSSIARLPKAEPKKKLGDILYEVVLQAGQRKGYKYIEPSDLEGIKNLRKPHTINDTALDKLEDKIHGAWMGRICGCMLGKTVEGIHTDELIPLLKQTDNYPLHRYICHSELTEEILGQYKYPLASREFADEINGMPVDDDTNYTVLAQIIIEKYGRDFTPYDVSRAWLEYQNKDTYCTAERVAFCNFIKGFEPPQSAIYKNPYREWIGAQIRGDYFGYINPGDPETAAEMAWRDASISHVKNGIYGEMFVSAMIAAAAATSNIEDIIRCGLAQIPCTSRLYEEIDSVLTDYHDGVSQKRCFAKIHRKYNEFDTHAWCHTLSNAMIVTASLLYGNGDYGKSIRMAVETGFDTDCNGATTGSILGMAHGIESIDPSWTRTINNTLHTSIFGVGTVSITELVKQTLSHLGEIAQHR